MKSLFATFSIVLVWVSCNLKSKEDNSVKTVNILTANTKPIEKSKSGITKAYVLGKFNYKTDSTFTKVSLEHSAKTLYLNKVVYADYIKMYKAAKKEGIDLTILSGTRNFNEQKNIWERKWKKYKTLDPITRAQKILEYSAMPSSSRHHWGTDLDLNSLSNSYFSSGKGKATYNWLQANANNYGFYQVYTNKENGRTGCNLEKWHWSYLPLASRYLDFYNTNVTISDISGFEGSELAKDLNIIEDYINGISKKAKEYK